MATIAACSSGSGPSAAPSGMPPSPDTGDAASTDGQTASTDAGAPVVDASPPPSPPGHDFASRCGASGVLRCVGFDDPKDIAGQIGDPTGILPGSVSSPTLDTSTKASGASSLKFAIIANADDNPAGSYFANFSDDFSVQFSDGQEFFVQWRQRFTPEMITTMWLQADGSTTAWKQTIIGTGDQPGCSPSAVGDLESGQGHCAFSCTALEIVTIDDYDLRFPVMYDSCTGSTSHGPYDPFEEPYGSDDFKLENALPAPYCTYHTQGNGTHGDCFLYQPNEWMTFQAHVKLGRRSNDEWVGSIVELFVAREGQPSVRVVDWGDTAAGHPAYNLTAGNPALDERFGKVWLLPYMTGKASSQPNAAAATWYDELIVSRQKIVDP
jgi:hypothetical protein